MISSTIHPIYSENEQFECFANLLINFKGQKVFVLVDENSKKFCLPLVRPILETYEAFIIEIQSGEENKTLGTCEVIWNFLLKKKADRNSVLINLGGGIITDIGGFVASTYKRGIKFINIPTTVLGMVDAAIGGKTGIDLKMLKNQIGVFSYPEAVIINPIFIKTLPIRQLNSGIGEIIKSALIGDASLWDKIVKQHGLQITNWEPFITDSLKIKNAIVSEDPKEKGVRKLLNFGHTIGHAIETYSLKKDDIPLLHGEAVTIGIICEAYLSNKLIKLPAAQLDQIISFILDHYHFYEIKPEAVEVIIELMKQDKKNENGKINFSLISSIGLGVIDQYCDMELIEKSLKFYSQLNRI